MENQKKLDGLNALLSLFEDKNISNDEERLKRAEKALVEQVLKRACVGMLFYLFCMMRLS